jgi:HTH-type transcriptional regulator/antitoxin HigA
VTRRPAQLFHPSEFIRDELEARGWSVAELARRMGCPVKDATDLVNGQERITLKTAVWLQAAYMVSAEMWLNLQTMWDDADNGQRGGPV